MDITKVIYYNRYIKSAFKEYRVSIYYDNDNFIESAYFNNQKDALDYFYYLEDTYKLALVNTKYRKVFYNNKACEDYELESAVIAKVKPSTYAKLKGEI